MSWFKVDDRLPSSRKVRKLGHDRLPAMGLWTLCGSWASSATDGFVPNEEVTRYDPEHYYAKRLCEVGLWEVAEDDGESGYAFHDWGDYQPSQQQQQKKRDDTRRRVQEFRGRKRAEQAKRDEDGAREHAARERNPEPGNPSNAERNALRRNARNAAGNAAPDPTRPVPEETSAPTERPEPGADTDETTELAINRQAQAIAKEYTSRVPLSRFPAVFSIVKRAVKSGRYSTADLSAALVRMAEDNRSVTIDALRIELEGFPMTRAQPRTPTSNERAQDALSLAARYQQQELEQAQHHQLETGTWG